MARSFSGILSATPAIEITRFEVGNAGPTAGQYGAYGTFGFNWPTLEGISISGIMPYGVPLNYGSFDEATVLTGAHGPEWSSPGVHAQLISKSGGNRYAGTVHAEYQHRDWQAHNISDDQISSVRPSVTSTEANREWAYHDVNADAGGYLKREYLWWYASVRHQQIAARHVNFPPAPVEQNLASMTAKLTTQVAPNHKLVFFGYAGGNEQPYKLDAFTVNAQAVRNETAASTTGQRARGWVWKAEWNAWFASNWFVEARVGQFGARRSESPNGAGPRVEDSVTQIVRGGNRSWEANIRRDHLTASASRFLEGPLGAHQLKTGVEFSRTVDAEYWRASYEGGVLHVLRDSLPSEVFLFSTPSRAEEGLDALAFYVGDSWRAHRRLTVNLGLRLERFRVFLPAQQHPASGPAVWQFPSVPNLIDWNTTAPRLGATFDLAGDGRTMLKGTYAYYALPPGAVGENSNPNSAAWWRRYRWSDASLDGIWQPGEEDTTQLLASRGGDRLETIDPGLVLGSLHEVTASIEREVATDTVVRTGVVWRVEPQPFMRQNVTWPFAAFSVPVEIADPGPDGRPGTPDDGGMIQGYELDPQLRTLPPQNVLKNVPGADASHLTWELTVSKRLSHRWSLAAAFAHMWSRDQAFGYFGQQLRSNAYPITPNDLINADEEGRYRFTTWTLKIHGTCQAPWGVQVTPLLRWQSGQPFGRTFTRRLNYADVRILAEPVGTRRMDDVALFDVRTEKRFAIGGGRSAGVFVDLFNLLNANPEQNINWSSGSSFLRPTVIVAPRVARLGMRLNW
jgi:hypothetical protein